MSPVTEIICYASTLTLFFSTWGLLVFQANYLFWQVFEKRNRIYQMVKKYIDIFNRKLCSLFANPVSPGWGDWLAGGKLTFIQSEQRHGNFLNRQTNHSSLPWVGGFSETLEFHCYNQGHLGKTRISLVTLAFKNIGQHLLICQAWWAYH